MAAFKDVLWFGGTFPLVGIVLCVHEQHDDHGEEGQPGAYIGAAAGLDENADIKHIMEHGSYLHRGQLDHLLRHFGKVDPK